jgi:hypothetical protein
MDGTASGLKRFARKGVYLLLYFIFFSLLLEIGLRVYNPLGLRIKGDRIMLPVSQRITITNRINPKLDSIIINTRNSLGFRGPELADGQGLGKEQGLTKEQGLVKEQGLLKIITIGGSAMECRLLSDDKTWPFLLGRNLADTFPNCWLNNAGMDGHSTYGNLIMLNDYVKKLRPSVVVFLTGINDVETTGPLFHDKQNTRNAYSDFGHYIFNNSELLNVALTLARGWRDQQFDNTTGAMLELDSSRRLVLPEKVIKERLGRQSHYLTGYRERLVEMADTCLAWHILPVFLTQPNLFGVGKDPVTGADLESYPTDTRDAGMNGRLMWEMLEEYNDVVRSICLEKRLPVVDLARLMPKNSIYFYDMSHFTNAGSEKAAGLLSAELTPVLRHYFPEDSK